MTESPPKKARSMSPVAMTLKEQIERVMRIAEERHSKLAESLPKLQAQANSCPDRMPSMSVEGLKVTIGDGKAWTEVNIAGEMIVFSPNGEYNASTTYSGKLVVTDPKIRSFLEGFERTIKLKLLKEGKPPKKLVPILADCKNDDELLAKFDTSGIKVFFPWKVDDEGRFSIKTKMHVLNEGTMVTETDERAVEGLNSFCQGQFAEMKNTTKPLVYVGKPWSDATGQTSIPFTRIIKGGSDPIAFQGAVRVSIKCCPTFTLDPKKISSYPISPSFQLLTKSASSGETETAPDLSGAF